MKTIKRNILSSMAITAIIIITSAAYASSDTTLFKSNAQPKTYSLLIDANTPGIPRFDANNSGIFTISTSDGNNISFRYKGFGSWDDGCIYLNDGSGELFNITPINKITSVKASKKFALTYYVDYGYYDTHTKWQPDYQIIGNINYGVKDEEVFGLNHYFGPKEGYDMNVFRMHDAYFVDSKFQNIVISYTCGN